MSRPPLREALTFDDLLLEPLRSAVIPNDVSLKTTLVAGIELPIPLLSAAMDTVTEAPMAIAMAQVGGLGVIHRNLSPEQQADHVRQVKKYSQSLIVNPVTVGPDQTIGEAKQIMAERRVSGLPVVEGKRLVGILTHRDLRFETDRSLRVSEAMTKENLVTVTESTDLETAKRLLHEHRIEKLLVVNSRYELVGLMTIKDIEQNEKFPNANVDQNLSLRVGAAIGIGADREERFDRLKAAGVDLFVVDTAHGHSTRVLDHVRWLKSKASIPVIAGNVATSGAVRDLVDNGADAVKVGVGPGSICTTRCVSGAGMPQMTAIFDCAEEAVKHGVPLIADGGIRYSGDVVKALAGGASAVMVGSLFAGTDESPGEMILYQGRSYKEHRGMGSLEAMRSGSRDRYAQDVGEKFVAEGIVGRVSYRGPVAEVVAQLAGGIRVGMGYCGARTIPELQKNARFVRVTLAGLRESHVHNVVISKEAPNYYTE